MENAKQAYGCTPLLCTLCSHALRQDFDQASCSADEYVRTGDTVTALQHDLVFSSSELNEPIASNAVVSALRFATTVV